MLNIKPINENQVVHVTVSGTVTKEDYEQLLPQLESLLQLHETVRFYVDLEGLSGFEAEALWEDIKFDAKHKDQYGKTAIVGDKRWEEWGTKISSFFLDAEMRFFYTAQSTQAWEWVNS